MCEIVLMAMVLLGIVVYIIWRQKKLCSEYRIVLTILWFLFGLCYLGYAYFLDTANSGAEGTITDAILTNAFSVFVLLVLQGLIKAEKHRGLWHLGIAVGFAIVLSILICYAKHCKVVKGDELVITLLMPIIVGAGGEMIHEWLKWFCGVQDEIIHSTPMKSDMYNHLGEAYFKLGDYEKSVESYTNAIQKDFNCEEAYLNRGISHAKLHHYEEAKQDFSKAFALNLHDERLQALIDLIVNVACENEKDTHKNGLEGK